MILHLYHVAFLTGLSRLSLRASAILCDNKVILDEIEQGNLQCQTLQNHAEDFIHYFKVT